MIDAQKAQEEAEYQAMTYAERLKHLEETQKKLNEEKKKGTITEEEYQAKIAESTAKIEEEKKMLELTKDAQDGFLSIKQRIIALKNKGDVA